MDKYCSKVCSCGEEIDAALESALKAVRYDEQKLTEGQKARVRENIGVDLTGYATEEFVTNKIAEAELGGEEVDLSGYAQKSELPTKISQLENDKGYLTEHQDISGKLDASKLPEAVNTALAQAKASGEFDGADGKDGAQGPKGDTGPQGEKGDKGDAGKDGSDGSPGKDGTSATHSWNGTVLTITSASGTSSADLKGDKGDQGIQGEKGEQGIQGVPGEKGEKGDTGSPGSPGSPGADGAKGDKGDKGDTGAAGSDGQRGTGILKVTTAPTSYTTATGGKNPIKRMSITTIKSQSGATEVLVGDQIEHSYYHYHVYYLDATYAYMDTSQSIRGAAGTTPKKGTDYWTDTDRQQMVSDVIAALPVYNGEVV